MTAATQITRGLLYSHGLFLLPALIRNFFGDKKIDKALETASLAVDWWKSLLPSWIVNIIEGKSPFAERDEGADEKKIDEAKAKLDESAKGLTGMFDIDSILGKVDWKQFDVNLGFTELKFGTKLKNMVSDLLSFQEGGFVNFTGPAMVHGTMQKPEFVLDNQATAVFMKAAQLLTGSQALEQNSKGVTVINDNRVTNTDNRNSSISQTSVAAKIQPPAMNEGI